MQEPLAVLGSPLTPRRYQAIAKFVASAKELCSPDEAFDIQLRQRVFTQLRGLFRPEARKALKQLQKILDPYEHAFAGAKAMLDQIDYENVGEFDFDSFETET
jgi:hypothetical protein